jgi:hypothetical protein
MITFMICSRLHEFNIGVLHPSPLKGNLVRHYEHSEVKKEVTHASLRREKLWIHGTEEILGLPYFLLLGMMSHPVLRLNRMLIVCVARNQVYTHTVQKMDIE